MLRQALRAILFLALAAALLDSTSIAQPPGAPDRVYFRDKKDGQIKDLPAELKASPTGYQIISASDKKVVATVSAADIVRVVPAVAPDELKLYMEQVNHEIKKDWEKARLGHAAMLKNAGSAPEKIRKYLEFRQAMTAARAADDATDEAAATAKTEEAIKLLDSFLTANKTGWEVWPVAQTCARLQITSTERKKEGDKDVEGKRMFEEAARTWGKLAKAADLAPDLKLEATLQEIDAKIRAGLRADAKALIDEALKTAPAGAIKDRLHIYSLAVKFGGNPNPAEGVAAIEAEIAKTKDPTVRAAAYGMLGELYLAAGNVRDAMWQYLWVEVVYNQDRDEVIKTLARLADVFRLQSDEDRAKSYRDKARRLRGGP